MSQENETNLSDELDALEAEDAPSAAPAFKVELDIDDAPFLEEEPEPEPEPEPVAPAPEKAPAKKTEEKTEKKPSFIKRFIDKLRSDKKLLFLTVGGLAILLVVPPVLFFLLSGEDAPPPPPPPPVQQAPVEKVEPVRAEPSEHLFPMEPFLVERKGSEGEIRFLRCAFTIVTGEQRIQQEMTLKKIVLRDAIYYYLHNKPLTFLLDNDTTSTIKVDLISVINEHLTLGKIDDLLIEDYFISK